MNITVLGAAGATGRLVVEQALAAGHNVTALVRKADQLSTNPATLRRVVGDATLSADLEPAFAGSAVVISALGAGIARHTDIMRRAASAIVAAADTTSVRRVVVLSAFGVGESARRAGPLHRLVINTLMKGTFTDKANGEAILRASDLEWTLVYPVTLFDGPPSMDVRAGATVPVKITSRISREDVAAFLLAEAVTPKWTRQLVTITTG